MADRRHTEPERGGVSPDQSGMSRMDEARTDEADEAVDEARMDEAGRMDEADEAVAMDDPGDAVAGRMDEADEAVAMDDPGDDDPDPDTVPRLNARHAVQKPNHRAVLDHNVTHLPYAPWCEICIQTRAADHPHRRSCPGQDHESMPKVYFDYGFFRSRVGTPLVPFLVGICGRTGMKFAAVMHERQSRLASSVAIVKKGLHDLGLHGEVTLRADGESALLDLLKAVAETRRPRTLVERGPRDDGQANGRAERAVRSVEEITRTLKADLEVRIPNAVDPHSGVFEWLLRHGTDLLNKRQPGADGLTPWQRLRGKVYAGELLQFGAPILHRLSGQVIGGVLVNRWHPGVWLGKTSDSDEHIIGTDGGNILRARAVKHIDAPLDSALIQSLRGCNRVNLATMNMKNVDSGMHSTSKPPHQADEVHEYASEVPVDEETLHQRGQPELSDEVLRQTRRELVRPTIDTRQWQITKKMLREHGLTPHCKGCQAHRMGHTHQTHNSECRRRLETAMADMPRLNQRFEASRVRNAAKRRGIQDATTEVTTTPVQDQVRAENIQEEHHDMDELVHDRRTRRRTQDETCTNMDDHDDRVAHHEPPPDDTRIHTFRPGQPGSSTDRDRNAKRVSTTPLEELDPRTTDCIPAPEDEMAVDGDDDEAPMQCEQDGDLRFCGRDVDVMIQDDEVDAMFGRQESKPEASDLMFCDNTCSDEWAEPDPWWTWDWNDEDEEDLDLELKVPSALVTAAKKTEIDQLNSFGTWRLVSKTEMDNDPTGKKVDTRWVLANKGTDTEPKVKARLVAKEYRTKSGGETLFSGTPGLASIKMLLSDVATHNNGRLLMIADVTGAFLYGKVTRRVYVTLPPEAGAEEGQVGLLERSLYGLRDAPQIWKRHLVATLTTMGFSESRTMPGVLRHETRQIWLVVHVDDLLCSGYEQDLQWLRDEMKRHYVLKTQMIGWNHESEGRYLKRTIRWDKKGITWSPNTNHVEMLKAEFGMDNCNPVRIPVTGDLANEENTVPMNSARARAFRSAAARVNYLAQDRPDLAVASCICAARMAQPMEGDEALLKKIVRYLQGVPMSATRFRWQGPIDTLTVKTDSDWAACRLTRKSKSGGALFVGTHCIGHWCKTQDRIARSSGEAELKSVCKGMAELLGLAFVMEFLRGEIPKLEHWVDASATIGMVHREGSGQLKHLHVRTLWVQEAVREYKVAVKKIPRTSNCADALCSMPRLENFGRMMAQLGQEYRREARLA